MNLSFGLHPEINMNRDELFGNFLVLTSISAEKIE